MQVHVALPFGMIQQRSTVTNSAAALQPPTSERPEEVPGKQSAIAHNHASCPPLQEQQQIARLLLASVVSEPRDTIINMANKKECYSPSTTHAQLEFEETTPLRQKYGNFGSTSMATMGTGMVVSAFLFAEEQQEQEEHRPPNLDGNWYGCPSTDQRNHYDCGEGNKISRHAPHFSSSAATTEQDMGGSFFLQELPVAAFPDDVLEHRKKECHVPVAMEWSDSVDLMEHSAVLEAEETLGEDIDKELKAEDFQDIFAALDCEPERRRIVLERPYYLTPGAAAELMKQEDQEAKEPSNMKPDYGKQEGRHRSLPLADAMVISDTIAPYELNGCVVGTLGTRLQKETQPGLSEEEGRELNECIVGTLGYLLQEETQPRLLAEEGRNASSIKHNHDFCSPFATYALNETAATTSKKTWKLYKKIDDDLIAPSLSKSPSLSNNHRINRGGRRCVSLSSILDQQTEQQQQRRRSTGTWPSGAVPKKKGALRQAPIPSTNYPLSPARFRLYQKDQWMEKYCELDAFAKLTGHTVVPYWYHANESLARWTKRQRYQFKLRSEGKVSTLTDERVAMLDELGFVWNSHTATWEERLAELEQYRKENGDCNVPSQYPINQKLATWVKVSLRATVEERSHPQSSNNNSFCCLL